MPDGDVFTRSVNPRWRHLVKAVRDGLPVEECVRRLEDGMAKELRKSGGLHHADLQRSLSTSDRESETRIADELRQLAKRHVFERVVPLLVTRGRFVTYDDAQQFVSYCLDGSRMELLARSLVRRPDARGLQRPPRSRSSTTDLLAEVAPLGANA